MYNVFFFEIFDYKRRLEKEGIVLVSGVPRGPLWLARINFNPCMDR